MNDKKSRELVNKNDVGFSGIIFLKWGCEQELRENCLQSSEGAAVNAATPTKSPICNCCHSCSCGPSCTCAVNRRAMPVKSESERDIDTMDGTYDCCICTNTTKGTANIMQCMTCSSNPVCASCYANWGQTVCSTCNCIVFITPKEWICSLYLSEISNRRVLKNMFVTLFLSLLAQNSMEQVDKPRTEKAHTFLDLSIDAPRSPVHEDKNQVVKCNSFLWSHFLTGHVFVLHACIFASISFTLSFLRLLVCAWWCMFWIPLSRPPSPRASSPPSAVFS